MGKIYVLLRDLTVLAFPYSGTGFITYAESEDDWIIHQVPIGQKNIKSNRTHIARVAFSDVISTGFTKPNVNTEHRK